MRLERYQSVQHIYNLRKGQSLSGGKNLTGTIEPTALNETNKGNSQPQVRSADEIKITPSAPRRTAYYTGYANIDNTIIDVLEGKNQEVKENVYAIIRKDFLPHDVQEMTEADRQALISLGTVKAEYIAENFLEKDERAPFLEAMRSIAKIGMKGQQGIDGTMQYDITSTVSIDGNGHVRESNLSEILFTMKKDAPEAYCKYQNLLESKRDSGAEASRFAMHWLMDGNLKLMLGNDSAYQRQQKEQYNELQKVVLNDTFANVNVSDKQQFLDSIREALKENTSLQTELFLEQIAKMAQAPGAYLIGKQLSLELRA